MTAGQPQGELLDVIRNRMGEPNKKSSGTIYHERSEPERERLMDEPNNPCTDQ